MGKAFRNAPYPQITEPQLPELILDEDSNIKSGCSFELLLKSHNIDIKDIEVASSNFAKLSSMSIPRMRCS